MGDNGNYILYIHIYISMYIYVYQELGMKMVGDQSLLSTLSFTDVMSGHQDG